MNRPKQKWIVLTNPDCPCQSRINLTGGESIQKLCVYHAKIQARWRDWQSRPKPVEIPRPPALPFESDDDAAEA